MNLQTLKDNILSESHREDLKDNLDAFIRRAEGRIARSIRAIEMLRPLILGESDRIAAEQPGYRLPNDFLEDREIALASDSVTLNQVRLKKIAASDLRLIRLNAPVRWYALKSDETGPIIEFRGNPGLNAEIRGEYFARLPALVNGSDTNQLLENHENIYLSAALFELYKHTQDLELAQAALDEFLNAADTIDQLAGRYLGGTQVFGRAVIGTPAGGGY